jgi:dTDP-L-rhamnose 4-epimerase
VRGVDLVFHLAAFGGFAPGLSEYFDVNVRAYAQLLEVAREVAPALSRVVVASTQAVYGEGTSACPTHGTFHPTQRHRKDLDALRWEVRCPTCGTVARSVPTSEDVVAPTTPYAVSKRCLEEVALRMPPAGGTSAAVRFALTYGRRQSARNPYCGIVPLFLQRLRRGRPVVVYEDGEQTRDFTHVTDVARAVVLAASHPGAAGQVLNVGSGRATSINEVIRTIATAAGVDPVLERPGWYREGEVRHLVTDNTRCVALGWSPRVTVEEGIADFCEWFLDRPAGPDPFPDGIAHMLEAGIVRCPRPPADVVGDARPEHLVGSGR